MDMKLEVVVIPVSDVDRAKEFYGRLGWRLDADFPFDNGFRVVQFTPPGSGCSIQFGTNITSAAPGSAQGLYLIVSDIEAARDELVARGAEVSEVFHAGTPGAQFQPDGTSGRVSGPAPDHASYGSFATFSDPDGNGWLLQEITTRLPGRIDAAETAFASAADLASALRRAAAAHGEHEKRTGEADANWPDWYAAYMVRGAGRRRSCRHERLRRDRARRRRARRALRRRAGRGRPARRRRRARAGRRRVLVLGLHPVEDAAAPGRGGARRARRAARQRAGRRRGRARLARLHGLELLRRRAGALAGRAAGIDLLRGTRPAGRHRRRRGRTASATPPSTSSWRPAPIRSSRPSRACASSTASGAPARRRA